MVMTMAAFAMMMMVMMLMMMLMMLMATMVVMAMVMMMTIMTMEDNDADGNDDDDDGDSVSEDKHQDHNNDSVQYDNSEHGDGQYAPHGKESFLRHTTKLSHTRGRAQRGVDPDSRSGGSGSVVLVGWTTRVERSAVNTRDVKLR